MRVHKLLLIALLLMVLALTVTLTLYFGIPSWEIAGLILLRVILTLGYLFALGWAARQATVRPMLFGVALAVGILLLFQVFSFPGTSTSVLIWASAGVLTFFLSRRNYVRKT